MDERTFQFKAGQPIPEWDLKHRLPIDKPVSSECKDTSTIFRINSTFMEVTDQPYRDRHWQAGGVLGTVFMAIISITPLVLIASNPVPRLNFAIAALCCLSISSIIYFTYMALKYGRDEFFSLRRRPIRFNREERKIYAIRRRRFFSKPGGGDITWEVPWDDKAIFCIYRGIVHRRLVFHIRHYEVDQNGNVIRAFAIGRTWEEDECLTGLLSQWNY